METEDVKDAPPDDNPPHGSNTEEEMDQAPFGDEEDD